MPTSDISSSSSEVLLEDLIIDEFQKLYYQFKTDGIYGVALILDQFYMPKFLTLSTEKSIFSEHEDHRQYLKMDNKWSIEIWRHKVNLANKNYCFEYANHANSGDSVLYHMYQNNGISKEQQSNLQRCLTSLSKAKIIYSRFIDFTQNILFFWRICIINLKFL